ncbi:MAG TPA: 50S ribosomal protein L18e [Methanospirillum sp.]|jgi:large subunit ribosomal protein L18e|uniref:50S ribosomal protein L18e n=1 Tax=Methanospirillum sp. TaxID=45200 RepID=UPI002BE02D7D|nr:50S ribosomal protein L18e [Methanospirillum sp.]HOJ96902.1 50S ribosomal protein L18e [Methanospirillum sp.]HOL41353.1 50S ribosomal protein L18e [Methanospirillum sp.]HPP78497.1 50S ribosomal protein L18e [Methanospirillum sp.]
MTRRNDKSNPRLAELIRLLKQTSRENEVEIWSDIASRLEKSRKNYAEVNVSKINRYAQEGETLIVPGKVLGSGVVEAGVTVAALSFSDAAVSKITKANGQCMSIEQLLSQNPKGSRTRILR